jgi:anti-sigma regulatory factor (Ser/Thr protein kinase)
MTSRTGLDAQRSQPDGSTDGPAADHSDGPDGPDGPRSRRLALAGVSGPVAIGRHFTRQALADWAWIIDPPDTSRQTVAADILLVVSELIANATVHAGGPIELAVAVTTDAGGGAGALRLEIADADPAMPVMPSPHRPVPGGGHGLYIVESICDRWGVIAGDEGKTVWAEVDVARLDADLVPLSEPALGAPVTASAPAVQE